MWNNVSEYQEWGFAETNNVMNKEYFTLSISSIPLLNIEATVLSDCSFL